MKVRITTMEITVEDIRDYVAMYENYDRPAIHKAICDKLNDIYSQKNSDYGNSFTKVRDEYPEAISIRLSDKLERLKTLKAGKKALVSDESIKDTLIDLANYAIMELVEMEIDEDRIGSLGGR